MIAGLAQKPVPVHGDAVGRIEVLFHVTEMKGIRYKISEKFPKQIEKSFPERPSAEDSLPEASR